MKTYSLAAAMAAASLSVASVSAAPISSNSPAIGSMNVTATVQLACTDLTVNDLDFGSLQQSNRDVDVPVNILVTCGSGAGYTVELDYGVNPAGTRQRQVSDAGSGEFIDYDLFQPDATGAAATSALWGDTANGEAYANTGTGSPQTLTATGRLHLLQSKSAGTYTDIVTVTLNF